MGTSSQLLFTDVERGSKFSIISKGLGLSTAAFRIQPWGQKFPGEVSESLRYWHKISLKLQVYNTGDLLFRTDLLFAQHIVLILLPKLHDFRSLPSSIWLISVHSADLNWNMMAPSLWTPPQPDFPKVQVRNIFYAPRHYIFRRTDHIVL